jgi:transcription antitermination factor NusG
VPEWDIDAIRKVVLSSAKVEPHPYLKCGQQVRVLKGPLAGIEGILTRIKNQYRVVLSVDLVQKAVAVEVDLAIIQPLEESRGNSLLRTYEPRLSLMQS